MNLISACKVCHHVIYHPEHLEVNLEADRRGLFLRYSLDCPACRRRSTFEYRLESVSADVNSAAQLTLRLATR